jgi:hypothetical protein
MPDEKSQSKPTTPSKAGETASDPNAEIMNPHATEDDLLAPTDPYADLDPTKVVGTYAMQPDPNDERPAPQPVVPPGVKLAPEDDEPGAPAIGGNE